MILNKVSARIIRLVPRLIALIATLIALPDDAGAQAGITSSPARLYYKTPKGSSGTGKLLIENPLERDLEVGLSIGDWKYDTLGENKFYDAGELKTSCAGWLKLPDGTFFTLKAHERKELKVIMNVPADADTSLPVHTAMLYLTQLNPSDAVSDNGAAIKVTVRMATKIYHTFSTTNKPDVEIADFKEGNIGDSIRTLELGIMSTGRLWVTGNVQIDLLNTGNGSKIKLDAMNFYSLPGDYRVVAARLPHNVPTGHYTATAVVKFEGADELKLAELEIDMDQKQHH